MINCTTCTLVKRNFTLMYRQGNIIFPFILSLISSFLFKILIGNITTECFYALILINLLLSSMMGIKNLIKQDNHDGTLQYLYIAGITCRILVYSQCISHFITSILPIIISIPLMGLMLDISIQNQIPIIITVTFISLTISPVSVLIASLTTSISNSLSIISLVIFPLLIPEFLIAGELLRNLTPEFIDMSIVYIMLGTTMIITPVSLFFSIINIKNCIL